MVKKRLRSGVVYKIECASCQAASCQAAYVGQTSRHLLTRIKEHQTPSSAVGKHTRKCQTKLSLDIVSILSSTTRGIAHLLTHEALHFEELGLALNPFIPKLGEKKLKNLIFVKLELN